MFFPWDGSKKSQYVFFRQETKCCFYHISKDAYVLKHTEKEKNQTGKLWYFKHQVTQSKALSVGKLIHGF